jgi:hypothetical protein
MNAQQARNFLYGLKDYKPLEEMPGLIEGIKETADLLELLGELQQLVSNMPGIDTKFSMNLLWVEKRDTLLAKLKVAEEQEG